MSYNSNMSFFFQFHKAIHTVFCQKEDVSMAHNRDLVLLNCLELWLGSPDKQRVQISCCIEIFFYSKINFQAEFWKWAQISTDLPNAWKTRLKNSHINPGLALRCGHPGGQLQVPKTEHFLCTLVSE